MASCCRLGEGFCSSVWSRRRSMVKGGGSLSVRVGVVGGHDEDEDGGIRIQYTGDRR
uniref:Uncharacterized protein n=1 Tax=Arundo donax TaxID=35708 RepID=A0A0A9AHT5_ARUDO